MHAIRGFRSLYSKLSISFSCVPQRAESSSDLIKVLEQPPHGVLELLLEWPRTEGIIILRCQCVCKAWREIFTEGGDERWLSICSREFSIPRSPSGSLLLHGARMPPPERDSTSPRPLIGNRYGTYRQGDQVMARYSSNGRWYPAVIEAVVPELDRVCYKVDWDDGDALDKIKEETDLRLVNTRGGVELDQSTDKQSRHRGWWDAPEGVVGGGKLAHLKLYRHLKMFGWWHAKGVEARDYVGKWYSAQVIGLDFGGSGGLSLTAPSGHTQRQTIEVTQGCVRLLVHFEGWTEKWDEWLVLPTEHQRLRTYNGGRIRMGQRTGGEYTSPDAGCVLGQTMGVKLRNGSHACVVGVTVWELPQEARVCQAGGVEQAGGGGAGEEGGEGDDWMHGLEAILGAPAGSLPSANSSSHEIHILLRLESGHHQWVVVNSQQKQTCTESERGRTGCDAGASLELSEHVEKWTRPYVAACRCQQCREVMGLQNLHI